jgi:hypothetical protein
MQSTKRNEIESEALFRDMASFGDAHFDPEWSLLKWKAYSNVHVEHFAGAMVHPIRESLAYVLVLLERNEGADAGRAREILLKVFDLQGRCPGHLRDGLWHYFAEESVFDWPIPDLNWADFNGMTLLMIWHLKRHLLDAATLERLREAVRLAAGCIRKRNVTMGYTNIAIKGTFVTLAAAELLEDDDLLEYAQDRARRLHTEIFRTSCFAEYNSPTYAAVSLAGLMAIDNFVRSESAKALALEIQHLFWHHVGLHFHASTRELAGPHSRAYSVRLNDAPHVLGAMLQKATQGRLSFDFFEGTHDRSFGAWYGYFLNPNLTEETQALLLDTNRKATVIEVAEARNKRVSWWRPVAAVPDPRDGSQILEKSIPARITTYLTPEFSLGTVNLQDGWEQRQSLIAYWKGEGSKPSYLRHRYLHDERPCCSGFFASGQSEGCVLAAGFLVQYCDHHVSVPADEISAEFMGPVLDIVQEGGTFEAWIGKRPLSDGTTTDWKEGEILWLRFPSFWAAVRLLVHRAEPFEGPAPTAVVKGNRLEARFPHYQGPRRTLRWTDFTTAQTCYALWMSPPQPDWILWQESIASQPARVSFSPREMEATLGSLCISLPGGVVPREELPARVRV